MDKNLKTALIVGGVVVAALIIGVSVIAALMGWRASGFGMMGGFGFMGLMGIFSTVVMGLIIWAVVAAARGAGGQSSSGAPGQPESALEILKKRYARGEINKAEYEEKKKDLA